MPEDALDSSASYPGPHVLLGSESHVFGKALFATMTDNYARVSMSPGATIEMAVSNSLCDLNQWIHSPDTHSHWPSLDSERAVRDICIDSPRTT